MASLPSSSPPRAASTRSGSLRGPPEDAEKQDPTSAASAQRTTGSPEPGSMPSDGQTSSRQLAGASDALHERPVVSDTMPNRPTEKRSELPEALSGWAGVERHLFKHDTDEMKYYAEDIDTLLVFAGLFSAFLTAFVVQTYPMLTDDDSATTNQLLALSVSTQLRATGTIIPSAVNSTLTSLLDSTPFTPSTAARAINILFFLSLILSIASAFFGILSKQWIREYLKWNSALALPRENVLVRQDRIEAWEAWNVAALISSIPALLELAMVLFLAGIVIILWTLDDVVAITITVFAAMFMIAASALTILPLAFKRCPYKSPTAWACVTAYHASRALFWRRAWILREWQKRYISILTPRQQGLEDFSDLWQYRCRGAAPSWRHLDLESCRQIRCRRDGKSAHTIDVNNAASQELARLTKDPPSRVHDLIKPTLVNVAESTLLIRALAWVKQSSQDPRVHMYTAECAASIHPAPRSEGALGPTDNSWAINTIANRCIALALLESKLLHPHSMFFSLSEAPNPTGPQSSPSNFVLDPAQRTAQEVKRLINTFPSIYRFFGGATSSPSIVLSVVGQMLIADLHRWCPHDDACYLGRIETCAIIMHLAHPTEGWYDDALRAMMSVDFSCGQFEELNSYVLQNTAYRQRLMLDNTGSLAYSDQVTTAEDKSRLLLQYFHSDFAAQGEGRTELFFKIAMTWFRQRGPLRNPESAQAVLQRLIVALDAIASEADLPGHTAVLSYSEILDFIAEDQQLLQLYAVELRQLSHATEAVYWKSKKDGSHVPFNMWSHLQFFFHAVHKNITSCEAHSCRWRAHVCDGGPDNEFKPCTLVPIRNSAANPQTAGAGPSVVVQTLPVPFNPDSPSSTGHSSPSPPSSSGVTAPPPRVEEA